MERRPFWKRILDEVDPFNVLEVGCGNGLNLEHLRDIIEVYGIDTWTGAFAEAHRRAPWAHLRGGDVRLIPYGASRFDLVISCTVLQHIADDAECIKAISELYRVSSRWVLVMEYDAPERTPVRWRDKDEGIVKRPWRSMVSGQEKMSGFLEQDEGFDRVSWWLMHK